MIEPSILTALDTLAQRYGAECAAHEITKARLGYAMQKIEQLEVAAESAKDGSVPGMALTPTQKKKWRDALSAYCLKAEEYRLHRGYSQLRPGVGYGLAADAIQIDDCSMFASKVTYYPSQHTGIHIPDPLGHHYSGIGNTNTMEANPDLYAVALDHSFFPGDYALWGPNKFDTTHTAICRKQGTMKTAIFTSHGHQSWRFANDAPEPITLPNFPEHLVGVFRQKLLA